MPNKPLRKSRPWHKSKPRVAFGRRTNNNYNFYNSSKWRKTSLAYRDAYPFCECDDCKLNALNKAAEVVDHTKGLQYLLDNNLNPFDWNELKSMAHKCHNKKSGRQAHYKLVGGQNTKNKTI